MKNKNNKKKMRKLFSLIVLTLFVFVFSTIFSIQTLALSANPLQNYVIEETKTIIFDVNLANYNGTTSFAVTPQGTITKLNDSLATYSWTPSLGQIGNYTLTFTITDDATNTSTQNRINVIKLNDPPIITSSSVGAQNVPQVTLSLITDRACTCKYSTTLVPYNQMPYTFAQLNSAKTEHEGKTPSLAQGTHTIYASCIDENGNYMLAPVQISLNINLRPSASISLDPNPPLKEGTIEVDITTSESLIGTPELKYSFDDDSTLRTIALIGSGTSWSGYIIIKDTDSERIGSFTFKGYDLTNLEGTEITSGKLFLIDTKAPSVIQSINIENLDDKIKIYWEEPNSENVKEYKIYRRVASGGVETVDHYDSTKGLYFYDKDVEYNQAYYYRVSILDSAGNEGPLSKEVFITRIPVITKNPQQEIAPVVEAKLDGKLEYILNEKIYQLDKTEMDISKADETLSRLLGTDNVDSIELLGVLTQLADSTTKITDLKNTLETFRTQALSESLFNTKVAEIMAQADSTWKNTPLEVKILDSSTYQEFTNDEKTTSIVSDYLSEYYKDISNKDIETSITDAKTLQDSIMVNVKLIKGEIKYPNETKPFSIVKKTLTSNDISGKAILFESIPEIVAKPDKLTFVEQPFYKQTYVFWNVDSLTNKKLDYVVYSDVNMADLKGVKSVVFVEQPLLDKQKAIQDKLTDSGNSITGGVTGDLEGSQNNILLVLIVAGVMIVCGLFAYYVFWSEEEGKDKPKLKSEQIKSEQLNSEHKITNIAENNTNNEHLHDEPQHKFDIGKLLFKKKKESILPNDAHRIITIEKPTEDVQNRTDSYDFQRFRTSNKSETTSEHPREEQPTKNNVAPTLHEHIEMHSNNNHSNNNISSHNISELNDVQDKLQKLKDNSKLEDIEDFDELRSKTYQIKTLCEEIEEQSIIEFTNKTKANLEKSLLYIARYVPPVKIEHKHTTTHDSETELVKSEIESEYNFKLKAQTELPKTNATNSMINSNPITLNNHKPNHFALEGKEFLFSDGSTAKTIADLKEKLFNMNEETFTQYVNNSKNDFATWIGNVFLDYDLAHKVRSVNSKEEIIGLLK